MNASPPRDEREGLKLRPPRARVPRSPARIVPGCLLLLALLPALRAAHPYAPKIADPFLDPWRWQKIVELDGKNPRTMTEGQDGAMWFGVVDGVMRFDGERWQTYTPKDGLMGGVSNVLSCAKDGRIYAGNGDGIGRFSEGRWERVFPTGPDRTAFINSLLVAADGSVWAGSRGFILHVQDKNITLYCPGSQSEALGKTFPEATIVTLPATVPMSGPVDLYETRDGAIWYGLTSGELVRHDPHRQAREDSAAWRVFTEADGYRLSNGTRKIFQTSDGLVWLGSTEPEPSIVRYDPVQDTWAYFSLMEILGGDNLVRSIVETRDGAVWFGGLARISRFHEGKWLAYRAPEIPLSSSRVVLLESQSGDLWSLGVGDEVQRIDCRASRLLKYEGLNFQGETPDGRQWFVAVDDGVVSFDGKQWQRHGVEDGLMSSPYTLFCTREGTLWAAGTHEGKAATAWLTGTTWHRKTHENIQPAFGYIIDYRAVLETADGCLWFGTYVNGRTPNGGDGGILQYDPRRGPPQDERAWQNHGSALFPGRSSNGIAQLADGRVFSASFASTMQFDGKTWTRSPDISIGADALGVSRDGQLWVGTRGEGLLRFDGKQVTRYGTADGLKSNAITALFCDRADHLWIGTSKGISYFDGKEWTTDVFLDATLAIDFEGGGFKQAADGALWINQCSRGWLRRVMPGNQPTPATLKKFSTIRYARESITPRAEIVTSMARVSQPGNAVIAWRGHSSWWRTKETDLRYSQRLDDGPWSKFAGETNHVFLQLPPGPHRVEVRARDRDMNVTPTPARVEFVVLPPVWQEPWFIALMAVMIGAVAIQTIRASIRGHRVRRSNRALAAEILEHERAEIQLKENTDRLKLELAERTRMEREIETTHKQLLVASREAGMAEIATGVLHNVGNVLNSVNVSATLVTDRVRESAAANVAKLAALLDQHKADLAGFLTQNPRGLKIPGYLNALAESLAVERTEVLDELGHLSTHIEHIKNIVAMQQAYARTSGVIETVAVPELIEDVLRINASALAGDELEIVRDFQARPVVAIDKHKAMQILINLLKNAKQACAAGGHSTRRITVRLTADEHRFTIAIVDNGEGIAAENITRIFSQGFTNKTGGHGFGLHHAALAAKELGGSLDAHSAGPGLGATFTLELPLAADVSSE